MSAPDKESISAADEKAKATPPQESLKETKTPDSLKISQPSHFDVLFGRGKPYQGHAGNIRLHKVVDLYKPRYSQARRHEKTEIAEEIVQFIKTGGAKAGRFLKRIDNEEAWVEVTDSVARDKVSHALRGKPRKESKHLASPAVLEELLSAKRAYGAASSFSGPMAKRKIQPFSELELLAAQRGSALAASGLMPGGSLLAGAGTNLHARSMQQQLLASAMAERQLAAGLAPPVGGMGMSLLSQATSGLHPSMAGAAADMNPLLLQQLAAGRQLRAAADPRLWM